MKYARSATGTEPAHASERHPYRETGDGIRVAGVCPLWFIDLMRAPR